MEVVVEVRPAISVRPGSFAHMGFTASYNGFCATVPNNPFIREFSTKHNLATKNAITTVEADGHDVIDIVFVNELMKV